MNVQRLGCDAASVLHVEPDGLLVTASMLPQGAGAVSHTLTLQISYLGSGNVLMYLHTSGDGDASMELMTLSGCGATAQPDVRLVRFDLPEGFSQHTVVMWGMPGGEDDARGELAIVMEGTPADMTATTRAAFTRTELPLHQLRPASSWARRPPVVS